MRARLNTLNEGIRIALEAIRATKIRAGLTISGVAIGVGVVVTMAAMITGIRSSILSPFEAGGAEGGGGRGEAQQPSDQQGRRGDAACERGWDAGHALRPSVAPSAARTVPGDGR